MKRLPRRDRSPRNALKNPVFQSLIHRGTGRYPREFQSFPSVRALAVDLSERDKDALREYVKSP